MTAAQKEKTAFFLDLSNDFLTSGYRSQIRNYDFNDDTAKKIDSIEQISSEIKNCRNCKLCEKRKNAVPGEGVLNPVLLVIGEGPGHDEDEQGRPFVGKAGQLLDKMLMSINLSRNTNCFIANVVKCRPPENRDPFPDESAACSHFLERQISVLKPKFILSAGGISAQMLLKTTSSIGSLRGKFKEIRFGSVTYPFLATYHPAFLLRNESMKRPAWEDLKLLRSKIDELN